MTRTTGLSDAPLIPVGAVLESARWAVPTEYASGEEYETQREALTAAIARREEQIARHLEHHGPVMAARYPHPESVTFDLRWKVTYPNGGGIDLVVKRVSHDTLAEARAHVARLDRLDAATGVTGR